MEAQSIILGMTETIHPSIKSFLAGTGLNDRALRLYGFHVGIIPAAMLVLIGLHLPRVLQISRPKAIGVVGILLIATGIFPAQLGSKYDPSVTPEFMLPEWYFLWVFALLRTWAPGFYVGILIPGALMAIMMAIPWLDRGRRPKLTDRPEFAVIGITSIAYWIYLTFRTLICVGPQALQIPPCGDDRSLPPDPRLLDLRLQTLDPLAQEQAPGKEEDLHRYIEGNRPMTILAFVIMAQAALLWAFASAFILGNTEVMALSLGFAVMGLGVAQHVYAVSYPK